MGRGAPDGCCPQGRRWCPSAGARCSARRRTPRTSGRWPACRPSSCRPSTPRAAGMGSAGPAQPPGSSLPHAHKRLQQPDGPLLTGQIFYLRTINIFRELCALLSRGPEGRPGLPVAPAVELLRGGQLPQRCGWEEAWVPAPGKGNNPVAVPQRAQRHRAALAPGTCLTTLVSPHRCQVRSRARLPVLGTGAGCGSAPGAQPAARDKGVLRPSLVLTVGTHTSCNPRCLAGV